MTFSNAALDYMGLPVAVANYHCAWRQKKYDNDSHVVRFGGATKITQCFA